jgi:prepilin-type N-terminal cleavage/methylation domain-containing protein
MKAKSPHLAAVVAIRSSFKRRGFTLVELLVVITIIAVLAGVVFAVTNSMKARAAASKSLSEVRQAGTLLLAKAAESNGRCQYFLGGKGSDLLTCGEN